MLHKGKGKVHRKIMYGTVCLGFLTIKNNLIASLTKKVREKVFTFVYR